MAIEPENNTTTPGTWAHALRRRIALHTTDSVRVWSAAIADGPRLLLLCALGVVLVPGSAAFAQPGGQNQTPAYLDDSTRTRETLKQLDELIRVGSLPEAARTLQTILEAEGDRVVESPTEAQLFIPVRSAVHAALLGRTELLGTYRRQQGPAAQQSLDAGDHRGVARSRFLTAAGYESALRLAQEHLEAARFATAWRTLRELATHPDRGAPGNADATARLAGMIALYLPNDHAASGTADDWAALAGPKNEFAGAPRAQRPAGLGTGDRPAVAIEPNTDEPPDLSGIVPTPLNSVALPIASPWSDLAARTPTRRTFWALPAILDSLTLINDGDVVTAYDRFTLRTRWSFPQRPNAAPPVADADRSRNRTRLIEDPTSVTAHGGRVLAVMGTVVSGRREGDPSIVCLDTQTGRLLWRARPDRLAPETNGASVRGPVAVYGDTAIVMLRRNERSRRTIAVSLAGLDLATGRLRWHRFLGAVGALPYQQQTRSPQSIAVIDGVAYATDEVGIIAAVDAESGRPEWVRRHAALASDNAQTTPWAIHAPVPAGGGTVLSVSPDRTELLALDRSSGAVLKRRPTPTLGAAAYLLPVAGAVALADASGVSIFDAEDITRSVLTRIQIPAARGPIVGRAIATRDALYAPVAAGVVRIPLDARAPEYISLDHTGNIDVAPGQLLAADDTKLRSYLVWDTASALLIERAEADPTNPEHAVTYAELAYRAGKADDVIPALDQAIRAVGAAPPTGETRAIAGRLFDSVLDMVDASHGSDPDADTGFARDSAFVSDLLARLDRLADSPAQRVSHLLAAGLQQERTADAAGAIASYQRILADGTLSNTPWRGERLSVRAELEATRRLLRVATDAGPGAYARFDREAQAAFADASGPRDPGTLRIVARRYPLSPAAVLARIGEAEALRDRDEERDAVIAGNAAVELLRRQARAGISHEPGLIGRAFGLQIAALAEANRIEEAAALLAEVSVSHPGVALRDASGPVDADTLFETISQRLAARRTGPRLGPRVLPDEEPQLIQGYALRPLARPEPRGVARARYDGTLVVAKQGGLLAWYTATDRDGPLTPAWTREIDRDPILLRTDEVSAWIFWPDETGGWLERTDLADGTPMWTSLSWADLALGVESPEADGGASDRFLDPLAGRVRRGELLIKTGARTLVFIERGGRAVSLDAATGKMLWAKPLPVSRVHDADLAAGVLAVAGVGRDAGGSLGPLLTAIDPRTGEVIYTDDRIPSSPRWVRITEAGHVLAGLQDRIVSAAPFESRVNWEISEQPVFETREAWLNGTRLLVRAEDDAIWQIDSQSGQIAAEPLETRGRIDNTDRIVVRETGKRLILAASDGVCVFDNAGLLAGLDAFSQPARLLPAVIGENTIAALKIERGRFGIGGSRFVVNLMSHKSAQITHDAAVTLFGDPTDMQAIDGRLLITAGDLTAVIRVPLSE